MFITQIVSTIVSQPWQEPLLTSYGELREATSVLVEVFTDEGVSGIGQADAPAPWLAYGDTAEATKANIDYYLAPRLAGQDPMEIERLVAVMDKTVPNGSQSKSGVEFALWDIKGKALNVPVYQLLGGRVRPGVPLNVLVPRSSPARVAESVERYLAEGWSLLKAKIGLGPAEDLRFYRLLREIAGDRAKFQLDGNCGYTFAEALPTLKEMERIGGLGIVEQPVRYLHEMAELNRHLDVPLMADESVNSLPEAMHAIRLNAAHVIHLKFHKYGGLLKSKKIAAVAEAAGVELSAEPYPELQQAVAAHFAACTPNVTWPTPISELRGSILAEPLPILDKMLVPLDKPGLGIELDRDAVKHYQVNR